MAEFYESDQEYDEDVYSEEGDSDYMEGMEVEEGGIKSSASFHFDVLTPDKIQSKMFDIVDEVNTVFQLPRPVVRALLSHLKWDKDELLSRYFSDSRDALYKESHLVVPKKQLELIKPKVWQSHRALVMSFEVRSTVELSLFIAQLTVQCGASATQVHEIVCDICYCSYGKKVSFPPILPSYPNNPPPTPTIPLLPQQSPSYPNNPPPTPTIPLLPQQSPSYPNNPPPTPTIPLLPQQSPSYPNNPPPTPTIPLLPQQSPSYPNNPPPTPTIPLLPQQSPSYPNNPPPTPTNPLSSQQTPSYPNNPIPTPPLGYDWLGMWTSLLPPVLGGVPEDNDIGTRSLRGTYLPQPTVYTRHSLNVSFPPS